MQIETGCDQRNEGATADLHGSLRGTDGMEAVLAATAGHEPSAAKPTGNEPARPEFIGAYQILAPIAQGGMAQVYLARPPGATGAHRQVAVKRLRPEMANDQRFIDMFLDELQISSRVCHPNVCTVLDFGASNGEAFMVMEHLVGETLSNVRRKLSHLASTKPSALSVKERIAFVCNVIADACEGLHAAHEQKDIEGHPLQIVHRDVSPENLLVTFDGCVKVLDFGVARASCQTHTTQAGDVKGKFAYMAPEILEGQAATRRTDVWGLGVVLWEMLTLKRLFRQESDAQTLQAVMKMNIEPPSAHQAGIPAALDAIVMAALNRDPKQRVATARDLGQALATFLTRRRIVTSPACTAAFMQLLFPSGAEDKRCQMLAAISGKPFVEQTKDTAPSRAHACEASEPSTGRIRTRATQVIRSIRRRPWRMALVSGVTGAGLWWTLGNGDVGLQLSRAEAKSAPATTEGTPMDPHLQMARVLSAAGAHIDVVQSSDDSVTVRIKLGSPVAPAVASESTAAPVQ